MRPRNDNIKELNALILIPFVQFVIIRIIRFLLKKQEEGHLHFSSPRFSDGAEGLAYNQPYIPLGTQREIVHDLYIQVAVIKSFRPHTKSHYVIFFVILQVPLIIRNPFL